MLVRFQSRDVVFSTMNMQLRCKNYTNVILYRSIKIYGIYLFTMQSV